MHWARPTENTEANWVKGWPNGDWKTRFEGENPEIKDWTVDVRWRPLEFYSVEKKPLLIEVTRKPNPKEYEPDSRDEHYYFCCCETKRGDLSILHLDGTSAPIHQMNDDLRRPLPEDFFSALFPTRESKRAYCEFFCSFLSAGKDEFSTERDTFVVLRMALLDWPKWKPNRETFVARRLAPLLSDEVVAPDYPKTFGEMKQSVEGPVRDIGANDTVDDVTLKAYEIDNALPSDDLYRVIIMHGARIFRSVIYVQGDGSITMEGDEPLNKWKSDYPLARYVFNHALRRGRYVPLVYVKPPKEDDADDVVKKLKDCCAHSDPRNGEFDGFRINRQISGFSGQKFAHPLVFRRCEFMNDFDFSNVTVSGDIDFEDCKFLGKVNIAGALIEGSLRFRGCEFFGLSSGGPRKAPEDTTATRDRKEPAHCLQMDGLGIRGDLILLRCALFGNVSIQSATIRGRTRFEGARVTPDFDESVTSQGDKKIIIRDDFLDNRDHGAGYGCVALDLRDSRFERGLSLWAHFPKMDDNSVALSEAKKVFPTLIVGAVRCDRIFVGGSLVLGGLIVTKFNPEAFNVDPSEGGWPHVALTAATIEGDIKAWAPGVGSLDLWKHLRTIVCGHFFIDQANVLGRCDLRGLYIAGDLEGSSLACTGDLRLSSLYQSQLDVSAIRARSWQLDQLNSKPWYDLPASALIADGKELRTAVFGRTQIEGSLSLQGADVGVLYISGADIGTNINCNDGKFKRIEASAVISTIGADSKQVLVDARATAPTANLPSYLASNAGKIVSASVTKLGSHDDVTLLLMRTEAEMLSLRNAEVSGPVILEGLWLSSQHDAIGISRREEVCAWASAVLTNPAILSIPSEPDNRLVIENSVIEGEVRFYGAQAIGNLIENTTDDEWQDKFDPNHERRGRNSKVNYLVNGIPRDHACAWIAGNLIVQNSRIDGELDLSGLAVDGKLQLKDVVIAGDLTTDGSKISRSVLSTVAHDVDMEMARCDADMKLNHIVACGKFYAPNMAVKGRLHLHDEVWPRTLIAGDEIVLDGLEAKWLRTPPSLGQPMSLELAKVGRIDFIEPLPTKVSLRGIAVEQIAFEGRPPANTNLTPRERLFRAISADEDDPSRIEASALFERLLRKEGRHEEADLEYARVLQGINGWLFWTLTSTRGKRRVAWASCLLIVAGCALTWPTSNWESPKLAGLAESASGHAIASAATAVGPDHAEAMPLVESIVRGIEIAIPMISLTPKDNPSDPRLLATCEPASPSKCYSFPDIVSSAARGKLSWVSVAPATLAYGIKALGWFVFPLLTVMLSGVLSRR